MAQFKNIEDAAAQIAGLIGGTKKGDMILIGEDARAAGRAWILYARRILS